jgi:hypothetical protein
MSENQIFANEFNDCMINESLKCPVKFNFADFVVTDSTISNIGGGISNKLTKLLLNNYFPENSISEYHHFTDIDAFKNMIETKVLWLFSVEKRFIEEEFLPFYRAHGMDGYENRKNSNGISDAEELAKNAFYISFTTDNLQKSVEKNMWSYFAKVTGVRLVFEVANTTTDLRQVYYPQNPKQTDIPLLTKFIEIAQKRNKFLLIERIATIGFFYLPNKYSAENEYRLLVKRDTGDFFKFVFGQKNGYEYMEFPFNQSNPLGEFKLKKIILGLNTDKARVLEIIKSNSEFANIPIENSLI